MITPSIARLTASLLLGLLLTAILVARRIKGALLFGIIGTTIMAIIANAPRRKAPAPSS